ncbi:hypothetical protein [Nonomuraea sp. NPDC049758]|uniref:hypothetical protein n=1 Tax=Nonomuraea sp. NPDC049758 TaxID=3154360 RepID=UPI00341B851F
MARKAAKSQQEPDARQLAVVDAPRRKPVTSNAQAKTPVARRTAPKDLYRLTVRTTPEMNDRLTAAHQRYQLGPQPIVIQAINAYADALDVPRDLPIPRPEDRPRRAAPTTQDRRSRSPRGVRREEPPKIGTRLDPLTDARLTAVWELTGDGPERIVNTALNVWMSRRGIRGSGTASASISA